MINEMKGVNKTILTQMVSLAADYVLEELEKAIETKRRQGGENTAFTFEDYDLLQRSILPEAGHGYLNRDQLQKFFWNLWKK